MADSPSKRRKTSPTTSIPLTAQGTPSRIPVPRQAAISGRPSFASPTKSSIARHNPQLLNRPASSGGGVETPRTRRNLQDVFARALGETQSQPVVAGQAGFVVEAQDSSRSESTTQENDSATERAITPGRSTRSMGGRLSAKPRRMSRSPIKPTRTPVKRPVVDMPDLDAISNPFQKKGLRRSPIPGSQTEPVQSQPQEQPLQETTVDPFKKRGLRRSPIASQQPQSLVATESRTQVEEPEELTTTPPGPPPSNAIQPAVAVPGGLETDTPKTPQAGSPLRSKRGKDKQIGGSSKQSPLQKAPPPERDLSNTDLDGSESHRIDQSLQDNNSPAASQAAEQIEVEPPQPSDTNGTSQPRTRQAKNMIYSQEQLAMEEPELPPTPTQRGIPDPVVTTRPTGIHNTPSKRAKRNKAMSTKIKSSPLKPRDPAPEEPKPVDKTSDSERLTAEKPELAQRRKSARFLAPVDPHAAKKKTLEHLRKELEQLEADISLANEENKRFRLRQENKKSAPSTTKDPDGLVAMLARATGPEVESGHKPKVTSIFKSIGQFLPFRSRRRINSVPEPISEKSIPSHLPIELQDPLPYLQAFSPLIYNQAITLLPAGSEDEEPTLQQHLINASHPSGLFTARISMVVDTPSLTIKSLEIVKLDVTAEAELGSFIRQRASDTGPLGRDISVVCWAMGRWIEVALTRAKFWCAVEQEFGNISALKDSVTKSRIKSRKRKHLEEGDISQDVQVEKAEEQPKWTRRQLLQHMSRTNMEISNGEGVELRIEWKLMFDWTGEVESAITADAGIPGHWRKADERKSFLKIPETFKRLVKEKGPLGAVRTTAGLLMSSSET